jgi:hypothetical protein
MDTDNAQIPTQSRERYPMVQEWEAIRPKFTNLYLQEDPQLKLLEIKETLAQEDGFHAELHMYKRRIKQWDICCHGRSHIW